MEKNKVWKTALYLRISKEDNKINESNSITNQREFLQSYVKSKKDLEIVSIKTDDGFSGGNYERPQFLELIREIEQGRINCVIVKDLSRLGRNYLETGKYIERFFTAKKIRFIAVNDNYDSLISDSNSIESSFVIPMKNILNDAFLEDISVKIKSSLKTKRENGNYVSPFAPYGYIKTEDKKLVVDEYACIYVKQIFKDKLIGYNEKAIADRLNKEGILSPYEYKKSIGLKYQTSFCKNKKPLWSAKAIKRILTNEIYIGDLVQGKTKSIDYHTKKTQSVPSQQWDIVHNNHEPIIEITAFENVQQLLKKDTRTSHKNKKLHIFSGFIYCGNCGEQMQIATVKKSNKDYIYYICSTHKKYKTCIYKNINIEHIQNFVLFSIKTQIASVLKFEDTFNKEELLALSNRKILNINNKIETCIKEKEVKNKYILRSYEDYVSSLISYDEYKIFKNSFLEEINNLETTINNLNKEKLKFRKNNEFDEIFNIFKNCSNIEKIDRAIVVCFVEKIIVYENYKVEIIFKYNDYINLFNQYVSSNELEIEEVI